MTLALAGVDIAPTAGSKALASSKTLAIFPAQNHLGMWLLWPQDNSSAPTMRSAGAAWTRVVVGWSATEYSPGVYQWAGADYAVQSAMAQGFQIILTVMANPSWAAATECGPLYPEHVVTYANFMRALVARYSAAPYNIRYFELGNEPDNADVLGHGWVGGCWGKGPNQAIGAGGDKYAAMLKVVYPAMKAANPNVQVALGALAYDLWIDEGGPFDRYFLDDLLAAGGGAYFDVINYHFFEVFSHKWGSIVGKGQALQTKVRVATGKTLPLMLTEFGAPSAKPPAGSDTNQYSEDLQARYVFKGFAQAISAGIYPIIWFQAVDHADLSGGYAYGLLRSDLTPKPGFIAFRTFAAALTGFTYLDRPANLGSLVEGYRFTNGATSKTVLWRNSTTAVNVFFAIGSPGGTIAVTDKGGAVITVVDGATGDLDGKRDGFVVLAVGPNPLIVSVVASSPPSPGPTPTSTPKPASTPAPTSPPTAGAKTKSFQNNVAPSTTYAGNIDTHVAEAQSTTKFGAATSVIVSGSDPVGTNKDKWALLKWNLASISGWVQSASLTLNVTDHSGGQTYELYEALATWSETTTTWSVKPAKGTTVLGVVAPTKTGALVVNLNTAGIAVVQKWLNTPTKNFGLYLQDSANTDTLKFDSSEKTTTSLRPKLTVTYKPPIITKAPWVQSITATGASVLWETDIYGKGTLNYRKKGVTAWTAKAVATTLVSGKWQAKAVLTGLTANTTYEYRVRASADSAWTGTSTFKTAAAVSAAMEGVTEESSADVVEGSDVLASPDSTTTAGDLPMVDLTPTLTATWTPVQTDSPIPGEPAPQATLSMTWTPTPTLTVMTASLTLTVTPTLTPTPSDAPQLPEGVPLDKEPIGAVPVITSTLLATPDALPHRIYLPLFIRVSSTRGASL